VPGFIARERGRYVWQILLQIPPGFATEKRNAILDNVPHEWEIDVDPETIL
jgi:primosomal protein N'